MSPTSSAEWQQFLTEFSARRPYAPEWGAQPPNQEWHGREPATEAELSAAEQRLGTDLPPDLRNFLACSNGWQNLDELYGLHSAAELRWVNDPQHDLLDVWSSFEEIIEVISGCLIVLDDGSGVYGLLRPNEQPKPNQQAYSWAAGDGEDPVPYPSFSAMVTALAEGAHQPAGSGRPSS
ncbi:SMI1/KNR4 family protein [Kineosporia babensis]|uniref:SMI1/KNR4 family protein n=1 Tax=Kineosporia babensis TaxID=499548 RepID=A0A9X1SW82_9ACTN|nr:SMI1/KNR4 family protein [Kineosporia babensis]MCD5309373.1 SMI1/KNR4 family protein [Kineosporia babensis]